MERISVIVRNILFIVLVFSSAQYAQRDSDHMAEVAKYLNSAPIFLKATIISSTKFPYKNKDTSSISRLPPITIIFNKIRILDTIKTDGNMTIGDTISFYFTHGDMLFRRWYVTELDTYFVALVPNKNREITFNYFLSAFQYPPVMDYVGTGPIFPGYFEITDGIVHDIKNAFGFGQLPWEEFKSRVLSIQ